MAGIPNPVVDPRFGAHWTSVLNALRQAGQFGPALNGSKAGVGSQTLVSAENTATFTPTNANDQELMSSPTVTIQVGTSGQVLLLVNSTISVGATNGNSVAWLLYYAYTPAGGRQVGPGSNLITSFSSYISVSGTPIPTVSLTNYGSVSGSITLRQLPAGQVTFNLYAETNGPTGNAAEFKNTEMIVWPL